MDDADKVVSQAESVTGTTCEESPHRIIGYLAMEVVSERRLHALHYAKLKAELERVTALLPSVRL
jgi:hypothetical protein